MDTSVSTPQAVATVISVEGQAFARDPAGQMRPLKPGDILREGDTIVTLAGGQVQLAFVDGHILTLLPNETFQFSAETSPNTRPDVAEASLPAGEAERVIQALERGENIDDQLDPTAAGLEGGGNNQGNDFVRLMRIVEPPLTPFESQFGTGPARVEFPEFPVDDNATLPVNNLATVEVTTLSLTSSASLAEGGNIIYTASVTRPALSAVVVTLSNGAIITIAAGASNGSISVPAPSDDVYLDAGLVSATISSVTGGDIESLVVDPTAARTSIADTVDATTVTLTASAASVTEGGSIVYTASLNNPVTGTPLVVTLSVITPYRDRNGIGTACTDRDRDRRAAT